MGRLKERIRAKEQEGTHTMLSVAERQKLAANKDLLRSELAALNVVKQQIRETFRDACKHHISMIKKCAKGFDVDRHLYALNCLHEKAGRKLSDGTVGAPEIKAMFRDTAWTKLNHTVLSTSNCGNPSLRLFGFGPVVPEGYGIGYIIKADSLNFCVTSKHRQTKRFVDTLRRTLLDMERACLRLWALPHCLPCSLISAHCSLPTHTLRSTIALPLSTWADLFHTEHKMDISNFHNHDGTATTRARGDSTEAYDYFGDLGAKGPATAKHRIGALGCQRMIGHFSYLSHPCHAMPSHPISYLLNKCREQSVLAEEDPGCYRVREGAGGGGSAGGGGREERRQVVTILRR